ncbi:hypothetical protein CDAR_529021 [Caerostris darwini]|uniref:Uncharacterized protein n=1 Tax=Caerostris darwini TaxID=1538125 RepID=A0AAV4UD84_9ARAC|nr:hypothetical protein CDAR_529021 [Caerostris darwini]
MNGGGRKREEEDNSARSFLRAEEEKVCPCAAAVLGKALTQSLYPFEALERRPNLHFLFLFRLLLCGPKAADSEWKASEICTRHESSKQKSVHKTKREESGRQAGRDVWGFGLWVGGLGRGRCTMEPSLLQQGPRRSSYSSCGMPAEFASLAREAASEKTPLRLFLGNTSGSISCNGFVANECLFFEIQFRKRN